MTKRLWYWATHCECHYQIPYGWVVHSGCRIHDTWLQRILK